MKQSILISVAVYLLIAISLSCSDFVDNVTPPIDEIDSDKLTDESQMSFLIAGVQQRFATTYDQTILLADALSDAFFFDPNVPGATFVSFEDIDFGEIELDNSAVEAQFLQLGELRFLADDLLRRARQIEFVDLELRRQVFFTGHLYGGIARYLYATYTGLSETEGGGVIDNGPFIPSDEMYALALASLQEALDHTNSAYERRMLNSLIARCHLFNGNQSAARSSARDGLQEGDPPFQALYNSESANFYWSQAGRGQTQFVVDSLLVDCVTTDPAETTRIKIEPILGLDEETVFWRQARYPRVDSPIPFISWQENELMLAELEFNTGGVPSALGRVNRVRAAFGLSSLQTLLLEDIKAERDKTLFARGLRLVDQRRFGEFHLEGVWQYLPIPLVERINNPNLD
ncbi:MAG: hypothetical protein ACE5IY_09060 [bacterium]